MMDIIYGFLIACSMYSKIPVPHVEWTKNRLRYVFCFFPLIGIVIGASLLLLGWWARKYTIPVFAYSCFGTIIPIIITGGIHMDGFIDVVDARSSYQEPSKRLEILKDPHIGAFAVIKTIVYILLYAGVFSLLKTEALFAAAGIFVISRALSGLAVVVFPKAKGTGLVAAFSQKADKVMVMITLCFYLLGAAWWLWIWEGMKAVIILSFAIAIFIYYYWFAVKEFGGITGDLAGYFLQICELGMLIAIVVSL